MPDPGRRAWWPQPLNSHHDLVCVCLVTQSCPTLCDPMDYSPPGSSDHGDSPGKNTGVGCYALLQGIFPTQGSNPGLPHCKQILYGLSHQGSPRILEWISSVTQSCPTLCDPMDCNTWGFPVHHQFPELTETHVRWVGDAIQPSHPLSPTSPPAFNLPSIRVFSNESVPWISWPEYWSFSFIISPSNEYSGLISFRMDWLDLLVLQGTLMSLLQHHSSKASILWHSAFFMVQLSHLYMTTGKTIALTRWTFVGKVMSLLFNMLSRLVIAFLPRSRHLLISCLQSPSAVILEPQKIKSETVSIVSPSVYHEVMGPDALILVFWVLSFKPTFSLSSFTFIKKLFSSSSLSAIRAVSSAYLRLLIFLLAILIPAYASSSLAFHMMYSAYKLNKQGDNRQPWHTPFPIWNQSVVPCPVLTVASWPAHKFLRQVRWSVIPISWRIFHSLLWSTQSKALA